MRYHFIISEFFNAYDELTPTIVNSYLDLEGTKLTSLGQLTEVRGNLYLERLPLKSLGNLTKVRGLLNLYKSKITALGNLIYVGVDLNLHHTSIVSLDNLKEIGNHVYCTNKNHAKILSQNSPKFKNKIQPPVIR